MTHKDLADAREVTAIQERLKLLLELRTGDMSEPESRACLALHDLLPLTDHLPISPVVLRVLRAALLAALAELGVCA